MLMWKQFIFSILVILLTGCSNLLSSSIPDDRPGWTVTKAYQAALNGSDEQDIHHLRSRIIHHAVLVTNDTRLPNPDINVYVYPHYVQQGQTQVKIPGYTTKFPLYETVQYE